MLDLEKLKPHQRISNPPRYSFKNVYDVFEHKVRATPDKVMCIFPGEQEQNITFRAMGFYVRSLVLYLKACGFRKGDHISLLLGNSPEFLGFYLSAFYLGLVVVPINPELEAEEISYIVEDSRAKILLYEVSTLSKIENIQVKKVNVDELLSFRSLAKDEEYCGFRPELAELELVDHSVIIYTSGTTGKPKGAILTHLNLISDAHAIADWFKFDSTTRTLCILPMFHNNGQVVTFLAPLYVGGSTVIVDPKMGLSSFWKLIEKYECTWTSVVPSILSILLRWPDVKSKRETLKGILCGGQVLTKQIQTDFEQTFEVPIFEGFGLTETTSFACFNNFPAQKRRANSIGRPFSINEMKILDEEGIELKALSEGEICIRGLNVAEEYLNFTHKNTETFRAGWFHSGDFGFYDEEGYFYFSGRKDFLIIKGGENIYPSELEDVLFKHADVIDCAVIGIPDALLGEDLCAFVKLKEDSTLKSEELKNFCVGRIAQFKQPKKIIIINDLENLNEIPKGSTQKVLYRELKNFVTHI